MVCGPTDGSKVSPVTPVPLNVPPPGSAVSVRGPVPQTSEGVVKLIGLDGQRQVIE